MPQRATHTSFQKGQSGNPAGRPKGVKNRVTIEVKDMIEGALQKAGENVKRRKRNLKELEPGVAYLVEQAEKNPVAFMSLVGKIIPAKLDVDFKVMSAEVVGVLQDRKQRLNELRQMRDVTPEEVDK